MGNPISNDDSSKNSDIAAAERWDYCIVGLVVAISTMLGVWLNVWWHAGTFCSAAYLLITGCYSTHPAGAWLHYWLSTPERKLLGGKENKNGETDQQEGDESVGS